MSMNGLLDFKLVSGTTDGEEYYCSVVALAKDLRVNNIIIILTRHKI